MDDLKKIVWLASYPKSGNTWFRIFLSNILESSSSIKSINQLNRTMNASSRTLIDKYSGVSSANLTELETEKLRPLVYRTMAEQSDDLISESS